jgi:restriction endonuclease
MPIKNLAVGNILTNRELMDRFKVSNSGGMRRGHQTNSLVLVHNTTSSTTDSIYHDEWKVVNGKRILHYTGMGQVGGQDINFSQNKTLSESNMNNVDIYLFSNDAPNSYKTKERLDYLVLHILRNRKTKTESLGRFMFSH